ncbi:MAG: DNA polymerase III subunit delta' [Dehalococcoidia bacterium]
MGWTVVGQDDAIRVLSAAARGERLAHAYLFTGPAHVGKTMTAMQFAQALNCTAGDPPCGRCRQCERVASGMHADVEIIDRTAMCEDKDHKPGEHKSDNSRDIRICQILRVGRLSHNPPFEGAYRVWIIDPADAMNEPSSNALLKTLEEPPPNVVFVLVTDREEMLLPTIRSRTRRIEFQGVPKSVIEQTLRTRWDAEPPRAAELAGLSGGRLGWALIALRDAEMLTQHRELLDRAEAMAGAPLAERFAFGGQLGGKYTKDRAGVQATLAAWQEWWRDVLLIAGGREQQAMHRDRLDRLRPLAAQCGVGPAVRALRAITDARQQLEENASPVLALEAMMLALPALRLNAVAGRLAAQD